MEGVVFREVPKAKFGRVPYVTVPSLGLGFRV